MTVQVSLYKAGKARIHPELWEARTADEVLLIQQGTGWVFDPDHVSLDSMLLEVTELAAAGYARQPLVPGAPTWSAPTWTLPAGALVWPDLGVDEPIEAVVGYEAGVDDTASVPLWVLHDDTPGTTIATCDGSPLTVTVQLVGP